jgi:HlyD family secretion protein
MQKKKKSFWWIIPIAIIAALAGTVFYFRAHPVQAAAPTINLAALTTTKVVTGSVSTGISATGTLRTNQSASLAWSISGQVAKVLVKKGDQVKAGQVLASIDPSSSTTLISAQASLATAQQNLANLQNVSVAQANAQIALINAQTAVTSAQTALNNLKVLPTQAQIDAANATYLSDQQIVNKLQTTFDLYASRPVTDVTRAQALSALDAAIAKENADQSTLTYLQTYKPDANTLAQDQANLALAQANLAVAQTNYDAVKNGPDPVQVASAQANINSIQATLNQQNITAPFAGVITDLTVKPGDLVNSGTAAFQINDTSTLYVDLQVSEVDINKVTLGQQAQLTFDAIPNKQYSASVSDIGTVGTVSGGVANFTVTVALTNADSAAKPGMTASANVITNSVSNVLLVPNHAITTVGTRKIIYVLASGQVTRVPVTVGIASATQSQVTATTLKDGDIVITNPTALTTATSASTGIFGSLLRSLGVTTGGGGGFAGRGGFTGGAGGFPAGGAGGFGGGAGGGTFPGGGTGGGRTGGGTNGGGTTGGNGG